MPISGQVRRLWRANPKVRACGWGDMALTWTAPSAKRWNWNFFSRAKIAPRKVTGPLRICLISETLHAGVGRHIVDAACALSARGHEVHVLYSPFRLDPKFLAALEENPSIRCNPICMPHGICAADLTAFSQIRDYVRTHGPFDIVHGESSKGGGYARLLKLFGVGTIVYSPHAFVTFSPVVPFLKRAIYHTLEVVLAQLTDAVICSSHAEQEHGRSLGISESKLTVVVNGSTFASVPDREAVRTALGLASNKIVVGFVGRMEDQKAPQRLVDAAMQILPEVPDLHLLMIGDGPKREFLETRMMEAGLANRVSWLGAVDARQYMPAMDVFALPSLYEGFAYVLLEALYASLPIISTPVGGTYESIAPGVNGIIVAHNSTDQMVQALRRLALDSDLRRSMARASLERASQFSIPRMVEAIESLYFRTVSAKYGAVATATSAPVTTMSLQATNITH